MGERERALEDLGLIFCVRISVIRTAGGRRYTNLIKTYFRRKSSLISILDAYKGKKVFLTGHTGFKGSWLTEILLLAGATVTGYSTAPPTDPSLFDILELSGRMHSIEGDVRDLRHLKEAVREMSGTFGT